MNTISTPAPVIVVQTALTEKSTAFDFPLSYAEKFDAWQQAKVAKDTAERVEAELRKEFLALLPEQHKDQKFVLRVAGVARASVTKFSRSSVRGKELQAEHPAIFEKFSSTVDVQRVVSA